jgi:hypothetical protein
VSGIEARRLHAHGQTDRKKLQPRARAAMGKKRATVATMRPCPSRRSRSTTQQGQNGLPDTVCTLQAVESLCKNDDDGQ